MAGGPRLTQTYMMLYSPRDKAELEITRLILDAAVKYATFVPIR